MTFLLFPSVNPHELPTASRQHVSPHWKQVQRGEEEEEEDGQQVYSLSRRSDGALPPSLWPLLCHGALCLRLPLRLHWSRAVVLLVSRPFLSPPHHLPLLSHPPPSSAHKPAATSPRLSPVCITSFPTLAPSPPPPPPPAFPPLVLLPPLQPLHREFFGIAFIQGSAIASWRRGSASCWILD